MILPIVAYGSPILRTKTQSITADYAGLSNLLSDMWQTLNSSNGVGLAAPQVNHSIRLFIVDSRPIIADMDVEELAQISNDKGRRQAFINPQIVTITGDEWVYNEGCLSLPSLRENIFRQKNVCIQYQDENFVPHTESFTGITARIILHEYDHIEGRLFIDYLKPLRKKILESKLRDIASGKIKAHYKMLYL